MSPPRRRRTDPRHQAFDQSPTLGVTLIHTHLRAPLDFWGIVSRRPPVPCPAGGWTPPPASQAPPERKAVPEPPEEALPLLLDFPLP